MFAVSCQRLGESVRAVAQGVQLEAAGITGRVRAVPDFAVDQLAAAHVLATGGDTDGAGGLAVQVQLLDLAGHAEVIRVFAQQAPAAELGHEPHAIGQVRQIDLAAGMKAQRVRVLPAIAQTVGIVAQQARFDAVQRRVEVVGRAQQLRGAAAVFGALLDEPAGFQNRHHQRPGGVGVLLDKRAGAAEDFFRVIGPDGLGRRQGKAEILLHRAGGPGFADAETVDTPRLQVRDHLRRRHHHAVDILQRMNALARQPVIQPHGVGAGGKCLGEGEFWATLVHVAIQCFRTGHAQRLQAVGEIDALAVLVQAHQHGHVGRGHAADAQVHGVNQAVQAVGGIEFAADQFVPQVGPGRLALEVQGQAVGLGEPLGGGDHHRGAVAQGHEAEIDLGLFRGIAAIDPGQRAGWNFIHRLCTFIKKRRTRLLARARPGDDAIVLRPIPPLA